MPPAPSPKVIWQKGLKTHNRPRGWYAPIEGPHDVPIACAAMNKNNKRSRWIFRETKVEGQSDIIYFH
jgi:hypothetical protein